MLGDKISDHAQDEYLPHPLARDELSAWDDQCVVRNGPEAVNEEAFIPECQDIAVVGEVRQLIIHFCTSIQSMRDVEDGADRLEKPV